MAVGLDRHRVEDEGRRCARGGEACDIALAGSLITLHFSFGCSVMDFSNFSLLIVNLCN